jgi:hypothetical protein
MDTEIKPNNLPVMEYDSKTGQTIFRDWTDEERADNAEREQTPPTP